MTEQRYYFAPTESRFRIPTGPYSLDELKALARGGRPIKFFDEEGHLKGTVYPNGEVQT